ncbi:unnamed protein product [Blepharisma stoltei]|uniref:Uncharacterized protein n=1 Tax=Blepharisma stoltei TaxID=1481888 RepID=A0AAU9JNX2_9CILI|nr:unnamed protein product [Blepharisma stoltei]
MDTDRSRKRAAQSCDKFVCQLDLSKATKPIEKLGSTEYFRALKGHNSLRESKCKGIELPDDIEYAIDKAVRQRMQKGLFGYDNSQVIALELELENAEGNKKDNEKLFDELLSERLENAAKTMKTSEISFEDWKRRKAAEERLKKKLLVQALEIEYEEKLLEAEDKEVKKIESYKQVRNWERNKSKEEKVKKSEKNKAKADEESAKRKKIEESSKVYREWLKNNLIKLREKKIKEREEKKKIYEEKRKKEMEQMQRKMKAEEEYNAWLTRKSLSKNSTQRYESSEEFYQIKKPILMAYSPNRKSTPGDQFIDSFSDFSDSPQYSSKEEEIEKRGDAQVKASSKPPLPSQRSNKFTERQIKNENCHTFEELSSIRKSPQVNEVSHEISANPESFYSDI